MSRKRFSKKAKIELEKEEIRNYILEMWVNGYNADEISQELEMDEYAINRIIRNAKANGIIEESGIFFKKRRFIIPAEEEED